MTIEADLANLPIPILPIVAETSERTDWLARLTLSPGASLPWRRWRGASPLGIP